MKDIKFRGKRLDNGEWVYGDYFQSFGENKGYINSTHCLEMNKLDFIEIDYDTVGQFTGMIDKNDKEIYVGDIIKEEYYSALSIVEFGKLGYDYSYNGLTGFVLSDWYDENFGIYILEYGFDSKEIEVVGNVCDNKELL